MDTGGGPQDALCLPLKMIPGWLFSITTRISPNLQDKMNLYRERCFDVMWAAFKGDILTASPVCRRQPA